MAGTQVIAPECAAPPRSFGRTAYSSTLARKLGLSDATALVVTNVIGVGIFTTPAIIARLVPDPAAMLYLWIVGGLLALAGAVSYGELAKLCPKAGGEYNYLSQAFGPAAGFLSGWLSLISGFSGAIAATAMALVGYLGRYAPTLTSSAPLVSIPLGITTLTLSRQALAAVAVITLFTILHLCGLGPGRLAQKSLAVLLLGIVVIFIVAGVLAGRGSWANLHSPAGTYTLKDWLLALIPVMFTYSGWNAATYVSEETRYSRRTVSAALVIGTVIIIGVYIALNALYLKALPVALMSSTINVGDAAAQRLFGFGSGMVTAALVIALLGAISAMTIAGPRVYFAMGRDRVFIPALSRVSRRFRTPAYAIALQAACSIVLVLVGSFEQVLIYTGFAVVLSSGVTVFALYVIRRRRGIRASFWRTYVIPGAFFLSSMLIVINSICRDPKPSFYGLLLIAAGIPLFFILRRHPHEESRIETMPSLLKKEPIS